MIPPLGTESIGDWSYIKGFSHDFKASRVVFKAIFTIRDGEEARSHDL